MKEMGESEITVIQQGSGGMQKTPVENNELIMMAIQKDFDVDRLEKLLAMQERHEKRQAEKAYYAAMSAFKQNPPQILKDTSATIPTKAGITMSYKYARLGAICTALTEALARHGLSASWQTKQDRNQITVTCTLEHRDGHSRSTSLSGPVSDRGISEVQKMASTVTYLQRYTLLAITGIATLDQDDDDGASSPAAPPKPRAGRPVDPPKEDKGVVCGIVSEIKPLEKYTRITVDGVNYGTSKEDNVAAALQSKELQERVRINWVLWRGYKFIETISVLGELEDEQC